MTQAAAPLGESLDNAEMTPLHRRFWLLAALGVLLDGFDFFIIAVAAPLVTDQYNLSATMKGFVASAAIIGAIAGAGLLGPLADKLGRRRIFRFDLWALRCLLGRVHLRLGRLAADRLPLRPGNRDRPRLSDRGQLPRGGASGEGSRPLARRRLQPAGGGDPDRRARRSDRARGVPARELVADHARDRRHSGVGDHLPAPQGAGEPALAGAERARGGSRPGRRDAVRPSGRGHPDRPTAGGGSRGGPTRSRSAAALPPQHDPADDLHRRPLVPDGHRHLRRRDLHADAPRGDRDRRAERDLHLGRHHLHERHGRARHFLVVGFAAAIYMVERMGG